MGATPFRFNETSTHLLIRFRAAKFSPNIVKSYVLKVWCKELDPVHLLRGTCIDAGIPHIVVNQYCALPPRREKIDGVLRNL